MAKTYFIPAITWCAYCASEMSEMWIIVGLSHHAEWCAYLYSPPQRNLALPGYFRRVHYLKDTRLISTAFDVTEKLSKIANRIHHTPLYWCTEYVKPLPIISDLFWNYVPHYSHLILVSNKKLMKKYSPVIQLRKPVYPPR